jgi:ribosomal protein S20
MSQFKQDIQALQTALAAGNLEGAQKAFAAVQTDTSQFRASNATKTSDSAQGGSNPVQKDLQALQSALSAGDIAGAQKAFSAFQSDVKSARTHHGHHHRHAESNSTTVPANMTESAPSSNSNTGTLFNFTV